MRRALFLGLPLALLSAACTYDNGDARRILSETPSCQDSAATPVEAWIDVDAKIETHAGEGAGVFLEYAKGGHWTLRTACDVNVVKGGGPCAWDIIVTPEVGRTISNVVAQDLEAGTDTVGKFPDPSYPDSYQFVAETSDDLDGFTFDTEPQTAIAVDTFLDGACALPYIFWVGDGAAHTGAPSNPIVLVPTPE
ncbi:MAG TPA: hypothetical protein VER04_18585 [Polyangiaceae bacterium]|nr:hypothetical protein [Polyangiaceae bacterium]